MQNESVGDDLDDCFEREHDQKNELELFLHVHVTIMTSLYANSAPSMHTLRPNYAAIIGQIACHYLNVVISDNNSAAGKC